VKKPATNSDSIINIWKFNLFIFLFINFTYKVFI
jgi:hypothetical protein